MAPALTPLQEARRLIANREFARAEALLQPLLAGSGGGEAPQGPAGPAGGGGPDTPAAAVHHLLAIAAVLQERGSEALHHASQAAALTPADAQVQFTLGRAYKASHGLDNAVAAYRRALEIEPRYAEAWVSLGIALRHLGQLDEAIACHQRALALAPKLGVALANLALAQAQQAERAAEAEAPGSGDDTAPSEALVEATQRAVALDPGNAALHRNLGALLFAARRRREATDAYNQALGIEPGHVECCLRLGQCLASQGDSHHGIELYRRWLEVNPPAAPVMRALANLLTRDGRADEALMWSERVVALDPDPWALMQLCNAYQQCRRLDDAVATGRRAIALSGGRHETYPISLIAMCYAAEDEHALHELHTAYGRSLPPAAPRPEPRVAPPLPGAPAGRRLRVGYVSGDFVLHSVAYFFAALLEHHDRERFEVFCYHNRGWADAVTERFKSQADHWVECEGLSDEALRRRVASDGIDILVDLAGHTALSRLAVFARRAAPVQVGYLGYPTITGVPALDYRLTDHSIDPGDMPAAAGERPLAMPRSMFCYRPEDEVPIDPAPPSAARGFVTFGSFNNIAKLSDRTLALWARVLHAVPGSQLLLKSSAVAEAGNREGLERFMAAQGIAAERLRLVARIAQKQGHLALYNEVDVGLDPFPYNGATTTCEALWMGVPVVTRRGATHPARMGASILRAIGREAWVAHDDDGYIERAVALAADEPGRAAWRREARAHLQASELRDERGFARSVEAALQRAWQERMPTAAAGGDDPVRPD